ncbi:WD40 repeat domain-containing protein [Parachitinimonas caeni]|uniref:PQQ-binding-like beta-propeller repeat protein n=1 Tax=Parachitinimonas caeni TaxID=3031301 RepID=A0ABT7E3F0_9NEIS|nr:PQQ-binding-like beta-propeller repeat protein [Parachitinimonas caeni]MDK2126844.1 PQQ-binding-like beta-propeller repeat protein [Parachitinimonas caeni]
MNHRKLALPLLILPLTAAGQTNPTFQLSGQTYQLTIPYIESASGSKQAYSAKLTTSNVSSFTLDPGSVQAVAVQSGVENVSTYSVGTSGLTLTLPFVEHAGSTVTQSYAGQLVSSNGSQFTLQQASVGPAWSTASGGSCRPVTYDATTQSVFSGALKVELEDISQREGMQHVRFSNVSSNTLFFSVSVSSDDGRVGLMAPQAGTFFLSPGESLVGYVLYYGTGVAGAASYRMKFDFTTLDQATGKSTTTTDSFQRTVSFVRASETAVTVTDASTQLNYSRVAQATAQVGFWRYKVDDAETRIVLFPGQENWTNASAATSSKVLAYDLDGKLLWEYSPGNETWGGDATADGKYVAFTTASVVATKSSVLSVLDATTGKLLRSTDINVKTLAAPANPVPPTLAETDSREVRFNADGSLLAVGTGEGRGYVFNTADLSLKYAFQTEGQLRAIEFKGDYLYLGAGDGLLYKLKTADGSLVWKGYTTAWPYSEPAFSPDGRWVVVGAKSGGFTVLNTDTGSCVFSANYGTVRRAYFTPDGSQLIAATGATSAGTIAYQTAGWNVAWRGPMSAAASTTSDSHYTMMADGKAWIMDNNTGQRVATLDPGFSSNANYFKTAYLSKDGSRAVVARRDLTPGDVAIAFFKRQ